MSIGATVIELRVFNKKEKKKKNKMGKQFFVISLAKSGLAHNLILTCVVM